MLPFSLSGFAIQHITHIREILTITACATSPTAACPSCQHVSSHIHSYYTRSPQDLPVSGHIVQLVLRVRRFRCLNHTCQRQTFAERLPSLPVSARQTTRLATLLDGIAVVLSGQAGSRLTEQLAMPVSADTLLRRAKKKAPPSPTPRILGVDDFAFRRGRTYGTILINLESHQPVDVLEDRSAETFADWLRKHPGVEIISRDRSKDYLRGATEGAPQAQQVIDRWHLLKNLREAVERFLSHTQMPEEVRAEISLTIAPRQKRTSGERARSEGSRNRRLALYNQVVELSKQGGTIQGIARQLQISRQTVRKFVQASTFPEFQRVPRTKSAIDPYRPYLQERWEAGCRTIDQLWKDVQERGFTGSWMMVYRWVQLQQDERAEAADQTQQNTQTRTNKLAPRHLAWLFLHNPEHLEKQEREALALLRKVPSIETAYGLVQQFVVMLTVHNAKPLDTWLWDCQLSGISDLVTFAQGLEKEGSALHAAFTLPYSNGPVEGKINKLKYIKRSMYGRGGFPLLRQKVLKAG
ncbi:ISL3 family transposase [Dictyobacter aurantiacus]|nr:ISL3 family transposase [Dictyobacter aurantiacus]